MQTNAVPSLLPLASPSLPPLAGMQERGLPRWERPRSPVVQGAGYGVNPVAAPAWGSTCETGSSAGAWSCVQVRLGWRKQSSLCV